MTPEQLIEIIVDLTTLSDERKEEIVNALADESFDDAMNEELMGAMAEQEKLWSDEITDLQTEEQKRTEELSEFLTNLDTEHKTALRDAYQKVKIEIASAEKEAEETAKNLMSGADASEADSIRKSLGI